MRLGLSRLPEKVLDRIFLASVLFVSLVPYIGRLGFYYDDHADLGFMRTAPHQSLFGVIRALFELDPNTRNRPVQVLYQAGLYYLFGETAWPYHLTNALVFSAGILLFIAALQALRVPRILAIALPLVYSLLPNFSTDRFWYVAFVANLAMALCALAFWSQVRARQRSRTWPWLALAIACLVTANLAYEVFLPLFFLNPLIVWWFSRSDDTGARRFPWRALLAMVGTTLALVAFKLALSPRLPTKPMTWDQHLRAMKWVVTETLNSNFVVHGFGLPLLGWKALSFRDPLTVTLALATGAAVFLYVNRAARSNELGRLSKTTGWWLAVAGVAFCIIGYAVFAFNYQLSPTARSGIGNRTAIAATVGVAMTLVAAALAFSQLWPWPAVRRHAFSGLVAMLCCAGMAVNCTIATFWVTASNDGRAIMAGLREQFPQPPSGATILLDGSCPFRGPAVVFLQDWDATGALMQMYERRDIQGDVVTTYTRITDEGVKANNVYPYSKLFLYNHQQRRVFPLTDADAARRYFEAFNPDHSGGCPRFSWDNGVQIF